MYNVAQYTEAYHRFMRMYLRKSSLCSHLRRRRNQPLAPRGNKGLQLFFMEEDNDVNEAIISYIMRDSVSFKDHLQRPQNVGIFNNIIMGLSEFYKSGQQFQGENRNVYAESPKYIKLVRDTLVEIHTRDALLHLGYKI